MLTGIAHPSTPDVHSQAQWAQAVAHENEKLHQLTNLQKAIVSSLQEGHKATSAAVRRADELARTSQHAQRDSLEAGKLHTILLQHTGHAKVGPGTLSFSLQYSYAAAQQNLSTFHLAHDLQMEQESWQANGITQPNACAVSLREGAKLFLKTANF